MDTKTKHHFFTLVKYMYNVSIVLGFSHENLQNFHEIPGLAFHNHLPIVSSNYTLHKISPLPQGAYRWRWTDSLLSLHHPQAQWYCWWKKSCTSWYGSFFPLFTAFYTSQVVVWEFFHQRYHEEWLLLVTAFGDVHLSKKKKNANSIKFLQHPHENTQ